MDTNKRHAGYTLIELVIVVAVIGILAGIAYPAYKESGMKDRRADAKAGLMALQLAQEKYQAKCTRYADGIGSAMSCIADNFTLIGSTTSPDGHYAMSVVSADGMSYTLQAARISGGQQNGDNCGDYQITDSGVKTVVNAASGYDAARCW